MSWVALTNGEQISKRTETKTSYPNQLDMFSDTDQEDNVSESEINLIVEKLLLSNSSSDFEDNNWLPNSKISFSSWQKSHLQSVKKSESGIRCLLNSWFVTQKKLVPGTYCNATWDNVYCWPPTPIGTTVNRTCLDAFTETQPLYAPYLEGHGHRVCQTNGTWLWGNWTNYTECADSFDVLFDASLKHIEEGELVTNVQYILFFGSILSLICLLSAVTIFYYFRVLRCDRVTIHSHLMAALMLRYLMLLVITEPHILKRASNYRSFDMVCKGVLIIYLYATLTSISWMFVQGIYINGKLTTNVFHGRTPFKIYYTIGWVLPFVLMMIWTTIMHHSHDVHCWSGYANLNEIWIIICPIIFALIVNFLFLINILRVMLTKVRTQVPNSDILQIRRVAKATIFLFPLLGINNLLFLYNPGGDLHKYFVTLNTLFGSTQGILVAIVYCYMSKDVRAAFYRVYRRFMARRSAHLIHRHVTPRSIRSTSRTATSCLIVEQPLNPRKKGRRAKIVIQTSQLSSTDICGSSCGNHCNSSRQISDSPFQNFPHIDNSSTVNLPSSHSRNSIISATSESSCRIFISTNNDRIEYHRVHSSYGRSEGKSSLVSPDHPWNSYGSAVPPSEVVGSKPPGKNLLCRISIALRELN